MTSSPSPAPPAPPAPAGRGYRPELHGLRGLAIALVVLYHVFFDRVSGGVDVFLFISAFFLTGSFVRRMEDGRPTAPLAYWARTFKRSEEHTSELQSRFDLVCRLLLEKKNNHLLS